MMELGRMEKILDLREVWATEDEHFTPWLAKAGNLRLLGDTIGIELAFEAQEKDVGPFRADILCRDTITNNLVIIENQIEKTDHTHLGQILTYGAGLQAATIVWISKHFTEEHRATLDWLNEITKDSINFFGLEIELWRVGMSPIAPKFNVVCKPNDWTSIITGPKLSPTKKLQLDYWKMLKDFLEDNNSSLKTRKPFPMNWTSFAIGRAHFSLVASINIQENIINTYLYMDGPNAQQNFNQLSQQKAEIEKEFGSELCWSGDDSNKNCTITLSKNVVDISIRSDWPEQQKWFWKSLEAFHRVFAERIKNLDDYYSPE